MIVKILIENTSDPSNQLSAEHGLSVYVVHSGLRFLIDTGQSENYISNARESGIDLSLIDYVIITHGHYDHINGLPGFLKINTKAKIIVSPFALDDEFFSIRQNTKRFIGKNFAKDIIDFNRIVCISDYDKFQQIMFFINGSKPGSGSLEGCNYFKSSGNRYIPDDFNHEIIPCFKTQRGIVVFTGCAHQGLLNILDSVRSKVVSKKIAAAVGGFHLSEEKEKYEIIRLADYLDIHYPETIFYTGHCTGDVAFSLMKPILKERLISIYTGLEIII